MGNRILNLVIIATIAVAIAVSILAVYHRLNVDYYIKNNCELIASSNTTNDGWDKYYECEVK